MNRRLAALAVVGAAAASGCGVEGLSFRLDQRVDLLEPAERADVVLPVTIRWSVEDFPAGPGSGSFGVLIDRPPPPPGEGLAWLFRNDDTCGADGCPDPAYRAVRGVYETEAPELVVTAVTPNTERGDADEHELTVILLDADGRRVGEGSWSRRFDVEGFGS